jgi:hypothetical protein
MGVQCGFQFNILHRAVRVKCPTRSLLRLSILVESEDRRFIEDQLKEYMFPFKHALHRGLLAGTILGAPDSLFTGRMRACLGEYGNETELGLDAVNITRQGVARRLSSLKEAGDIPCCNGLKYQQAPENEVISIAGNPAVPRPFWLYTDNLPDHRFHLSPATIAGQHSCSSLISRASPDL